MLIERVRFAEGTPYHTAFEAESGAGERVMNPAVAGALHGALAEVVEEGTGRRLRSALHWPDGTAVTVGGKTGSGDNRYETFTPAGHLRSSRVVNRTATFAFYIGDRYFGVITAAVDGPVAQEYRFTSALPIAVLKLLAPQLEQRLSGKALTAAHLDACHGHCIASPSRPLVQKTCEFTVDNCGLQFSKHDQFGRIRWIDQIVSSLPSNATQHRHALR